MIRKALIILSPMIMSQLQHRPKLFLHNFKTIRALRVKRPLGLLRGEEIERKLPLGEVFLAQEVHSKVFLVEFEGFFGVCVGVGGWLIFFFFFFSFFFFFFSFSFSFFFLLLTFNTEHSLGKVVLLGDVGALTAGHNLDPIA